jgi:hypothetical protein
MNPLPRIFSCFMVERARPELLKRGYGDPYQQLKVDLRGYITF